MERHVIQSIARSAQQAPSGDNIQPWRFFSAGNHFSILRRAHSHEDGMFFCVPPVHAANNIAFGAAVENAVLTASSYGYTGEVRFTWTAEHDEVATITFEKSGYKADPLAKAIFRRRTDRRAYLEETLPDHIRHEVEECLSPWKGQVTWLSLPSEKSRAAELLADVEHIIWNNPVLREYIGSSFRYRDSARDGIHFTRMGLGWLTPFFPLVYKATERFPSLFPVFSRSAENNIRAKARASMALGLLSLEGEATDRETYFRGGRALERLWLSLTRAGISLQPLYGAVGCCQHSERGDRNLTQRTMKKRDRVVAEMKALFPVIRSQTPIILFRIGRPKDPLSKPGPRLEPEIIYE